MTVSAANVLYIADRGTSEIFRIALSGAEGQEIVDLPGGTSGTPGASPEASPQING
jgi:hypothetical protein